MLGKTHFSVGMAAGIAICRPQTMPMLIAGAGLAAFGGTICDIDVETSDAHEQVDRMLVVAVMLIVQSIVSAFWLRRFKQGPLEQLWRWATWGQWGVTSQTVAKISAASGQRE